MKSILTLAAATLLSALFAMGAAKAAPAGPQSTTPALQAQTLVQPVDYNRGRHGGRYYGHRGYGHRGGFFSFNFGSPYYGDSYYYRPAYESCRFWGRDCADRWGWRTYRWNQCIRYHGC